MGQVSIQIHGVVKHANHLEDLVCRNPVEDEVPGADDLADLGHRAAIDEMDAAQAWLLFFAAEAAEPQWVCRNCFQRCADERLVTSAHGIAEAVVGEAQDIDDVRLGIMGDAVLGHASVARLVAELVEVLGQVVAGDLVVLAAFQLHQSTGCCVAEGFELGAILGFLLQQQAQACPDDFAAILIAAGLHQLVDILLQRIGKDDVSSCHEVLQSADS